MAIGEPILLLLYSRGRLGFYNEAVCGKTRLNKLLFLMSRSKPLSDKFRQVKFHAGNYGAICDELVCQQNDLIGSKLVDEVRKKPSILTLSSEGLSTASKLWTNLDLNQKKAIFLIKYDYNLMSIHQLMEYLYTSYPEYASRTFLEAEETFDA